MKEFLWMNIGHSRCYLKGNSVYMVIFKHINSFLVSHTQNIKKRTLRSELSNHKERVLRYWQSKILDDIGMPELINDFNFFDKIFPILDGRIPSEFLNGNGSPFPCPLVDFAIASFADGIWINFQIFISNKSTQSIDREYLVHVNLVFFVLITLLIIFNCFILLFRILVIKLRWRFASFDLRNIKKWSLLLYFLVSFIRLIKMNP